MHVVLDELRFRPPNPKSKIRQSEISTDAQAVAVIGMGCIFPGAANVAEFGSCWLPGRDAKTPAPPDRWRADLAHRPGPPQPFRSPVTHGGYITDFHYDWRAHKIPPKQIEQADPLQFMLLDAADQALRDAGYDKKAFDRTRDGRGGGHRVRRRLRLPTADGPAAAGTGADAAPHRCGNLGVDAERAATIDDKFAEALLKHWPALSTSRAASAPARWPRGSTRRGT